MYNKLDFDTEFDQDSQNTRRTIGFRFNGETITVSGFSNDASGYAGGILGSVFKPVSYPVINDSVFPIKHDLLTNPIAVDLVFRFVEDDIVLMDSTDTELMYSAVSIALESSIPSHISSSVVISKCQSRDPAGIERIHFESLSDYIALSNVSTETNYPIKILASTFRVKSNSPYVMDEWPEVTRIPDLSELIYESCSIPQVIYNDSKPKVNRLGGYNGLLLKIELKEQEELKNIIKGIFAPTEDTLFRIFINPIFTTHTSVKGKVRILHPKKTSPIEDLTHIIFSCVSSNLDSPTHYRVILKSNDEILVDGSSTGEYGYLPSLNMNPLISPFRWLYSNYDTLLPIESGQIRYDGANDTDTGVPKKNSENIVLEVNENLAFKLRSYKTIEIEIYANDGVRGYTTNLWSF